MKTKFSAVLLAVIVMLATLGQAHGNQGALDAFTAQYGDKGINTCSLCHTSAPALNSYGAALATLPVTAAKLTAVESADSDGDGFSNIEEINAGTYPGDPNSKPASPPPTECTYTYSAWSDCQPDNTQSRTVISSSPAGCTGTPVLSQTCTYAPPPTTPPPTGAVIPLPHGKHVYTYGPIADPVVSDDPAQARPIGIGLIASGGDTVTIKANAGPFAGPVDVVFGIYDATFDARDIYFMNITEQLVPVTEAVQQEEKHNGHVKPSKKFKGLVKWKTNVTSVDETVIGPIPVADLSPGLYVLHLGVSPATVSAEDDDDSDESHDNFYRWITYFIVQ